ncbi:MAG: LTA synthase family protein [Clostridiales bacterium]|nr:LTA synthase family protein [Clostridiales bacterium]
MNIESQQQLLEHTDTPNSQNDLQNVKLLLRRNFIYPLLFFVGTIIYLEIVVHLYLFGSIDSKIIYPIMFAIPLGICFTLLTGLFNEFGNKLLMWIVTSISCLIFGLQAVYYNIFKVFFSFHSLGMADDALTEFTDDVNYAIRSNLLTIIILMIPLVILYILIKEVFICKKRSLKMQACIFAGLISFHLFAMALLPIHGKEDYTPYDLYFDSRVPELSGQQLGIITLTRFDLSGLLKGDDSILVAGDLKPEPTPIDSNEDVLAPTPIIEEGNAPDSNVWDDLPLPSPTPIPIDTSPNIINIDFEELARNEDNETIRTLHKYFANELPTYKNEYTGMFEGYNLIMITAEGFFPYAVHEELTPTLYKLTNEGFIFNNFYTALWQTSTSDGEYVAMTGLIPVGTRSMYHSRNNLMPFVLGNQFNLLGLTSKAYHNHTYTYYERNETHPNLGYDYKGVGNGLVLDSYVWPESDLEMIEHTVDEYINEEPFHIYYLTVSGHMNYTFIGNSMSSKNRDLVKELPYSSDVKAYIACQIELDRALEKLIESLTEAGVIDNTVIALSADHYPYGWDKKYLDEIAGHEVDPYFEIYKNHFILWNPAIETPIIIDKPASSLDILPTLSNLFGLAYDSRLLVGRDILSNNDPLVILSNRSFITDKVMYNSATGEVIKLTEEELPEDYIKNMNNIIKNKFKISKTILKTDYYRYVFPEYPKGLK